jgi:CopG family nickel-responsive transcriptional regulator
LNAAKGYANRSEAIRDLIRAELARTKISSADEGFGVLSYVYDHHVPRLVGTLTSLQHDVEEMIVSSLHIHVDHRNCLEIVILRGKMGRMQLFADKLIGTKGVKLGSFTPVADVTDLP